VTRRAVSLFAFVLLPLVACLGGLTAQDHASIAADGIRIGVCEAKAIGCKSDAERAGASPADVSRRCWPVYDECIAAHFKDGGADAKEAGDR